MKNNPLLGHMAAYRKSFVKPEPLFTVKKMQMSDILQYMTIFEQQLLNGLHSIASLWPKHSAELLRDQVQLGQMVTDRELSDGGQAVYLCRACSLAYLVALSMIEMMSNVDQAEYLHCYACLCRATQSLS